MKLLFINTEIDYGGAAKILVWLANQSAKAELDTTFLTFRGNSDCQKLDNKVKRMHLNVQDDMGGKNIVKTIWCLHQFIKKENFDIGIAFLSPSQLRLGLAAMGTHMKVLFSMRGDPYSSSHTLSLKIKLIQNINRWVFNRANGYVFQTEMAKNYYSTKIQASSTVIPNPISPMLRTKARISGGDKHIVCVARLYMRHKRQDILINAFKKISSKYPDYTLDLYGDGEDEEILKNMAIDCKQIRFMGKVNNVNEILQNATAFVLSSDSEGIPNALMESMSLGVPSISTDCSPGGASMLIQDKYNGIIVPRGDAEKLSKAMELIIENPILAEKMGARSMAINNRFSENKIFKMWLNFFYSLTKK